MDTDPNQIPAKVPTTTEVPDVPAPKPDAYPMSSAPLPEGTVIVKSTPAVQ